MIELFKIVSDIYDKNTVPDPRPAISSITRGHNKKLFKPFSNKNVRQKFFTVRTIEMNSLSYDVVNAPTVRPNTCTFKNRL